MSYAFPSHSQIAMLMLTMTLTVYIWVVVSSSNMNPILPWTGSKVQNSGNLCPLHSTCTKMKVMFVWFLQFDILTQMSPQPLHWSLCVNLVHIFSNGIVSHSDIETVIKVAALLSSCFFLKISRCFGVDFIIEIQTQARYRHCQPRSLVVSRTAIVILFWEPCAQITK